MSPKETALNIPNEVLTKRQMRFVDAIAQDDDRSGTKCAIDAGYAESSAAEMASVNLRNPHILKAITERKAELAAVAGVNVGMVLREWLDVARADANELVTVKVSRCDDCWAIPDRDLPVNPACPRCAGEGVKYVSVKDTSKLSGPARRLYAGAKQTKDGIVVLMRDQDAAWRSIADYLGMSNKSKGELSGPDGGPIPLAAVPLNTLTNEQLEEILRRNGKTVIQPHELTSGDINART